MTQNELDEKIHDAYTLFNENKSNKSIDYCKTVLAQCTKHGYQRGMGGCHALLAKIYIRKNEWNAALQQAEEAFSLYDQIGDKLSAAHQEYVIAYIYSEIEAIPTAIEHCQHALEVFIELDDSRGEADTHSLLGAIIIQKAEYDVALRHLEQAFTLKYRNNDLDGAGSDYINIAALYLNKDQSEKAIGYLQQAIELKEQYKRGVSTGSDSIGSFSYTYNRYVRSTPSNDGTIADAYLNLGVALSISGDYLGATENLERALTIKKDLGDTYGQAVAYNQFGNIFIETNEYSKAEWYLLEARLLFETLGNKHSEGTVWYNLGGIYLRTNRLDEAKDSLEKAEQLFSGLDIPYDELYLLQLRAELATKTEKIPLAEEVINVGIEVSRRIEAVEVEVDFLIQLAEIEEIRGNDNSTLLLYKDALKIARAHQLLPRVAKILHLRAVFHKKQGNYLEALEVFEEYHTVEKQIIHAQAARHLGGLQVMHEIALHRKNEDLARVQIAHLKSQLTMNNQYIFMYKKELNNFKAEILTITKQLDRAENIVRNVKNKLRESSEVQETWESYLEIFSTLHPDFYTKLRDQYPKLTESEVKVCVLLRAGLTSEEMAEILSLSERTIENKRLRIRHKFGLSERENLGRFLESI